jgi:hypothetical protein
MRHVSNGIVAGSAGAAGGRGRGRSPSGPLTKCPVDAVVSGAGCMDKYEASVWRVPNPTTTNKGLVAKIQQGKATAALLTRQAVRRGAAPEATTTRRAPPAARTAPTTSTR